MLLLAADTSGKHGSIAVARVQPSGSCEVIEIIPLAGGTFSAQLVPQIAELLAKHGFNKQEIAGFAVASGPGSFTGLRVGLAAIKALAEVLTKPIAAVSLLEVLAIASGMRGKIMAALDAGRGEVYVGKYKVTSGGAKLIDEQLLPHEDFLQSAQGWTVLTPDDSVAQAAHDRNLSVNKAERPRTDAIARLGWCKIQSGQTVSPEQLQANYIRRPDAEMFAKSDLGWRPTRN